MAGLGATIHTCSRNESELNECLSEWEMKGFSVTGSVCDVLSPTEREKLINKFSSLFNGKLSINVNSSLFTVHFLTAIASEIRGN